jgi:hypothetical protein
VVGCFKSNDNLGQLKTATGKVADGSTAWGTSKWGYAYDAACNLATRTNDGLNQLTPGEDEDRDYQELQAGC